VIVEAQAAGLPIVMSDGVPEEAVVVPALVRRLPLSEGPARWAEVIRRHSSVRSEMPDGAALAQMEASQFSCKQNLAALLELYRTTTR
jgi:glycosyltransferase EpsF